MHISGRDLVDGRGLDGRTGAPRKSPDAEIAISANLGASNASWLGEIALDASFLAGPAGPLDDSDAVGDHDAMA